MKTTNLFIITSILITSIVSVELLDPFSDRLAYTRGVDGEHL